MGERDDEAFLEFARADSTALLRTARLLTGDWAKGEDLLQATLARCWVYRRRMFATERPPAYARAVMASLAASSWRRRWRAETPVPEVPERSLQPDPTAGLDIRLSLNAALASLSARARAVIVLRYYEDWSVTDVAAALNCSTGTVKSLAARALDRLRAQPGVADLLGASPAGVAGVADLLAASPAGVAEVADLLGASPAGVAEVGAPKSTAESGGPVRNQSRGDFRSEPETTDPEVTQ